MPQGEIRIKESIRVLEECAAVQKKKGSDYQNPNSNVRQAMHYRRGIDSIHDLLQGKLYRAQSLLEAASQGSDAPNFESIEDTYMDLINYASFAVEYLRGKMDGQDPGRDIFNRRHLGQTGTDGPAGVSGELLVKSSTTPFIPAARASTPSGDMYS